MQLWSQSVGTIFMAPLMGIPRPHLESQPFPKGWDFLSKLLKVFKALIATFRNRNTSPTSRMVVRIKWDDACQAPVAVPGTDEEFYIWQLLLSYCKDCRMTSLTWFRHASSLMEPLQPALDKKWWRSIAIHSGPSALGNALMSKIGMTSRCLFSSEGKQTLKFMLAR